MQNHSLSFIESSNSTKQKDEEIDRLEHFAKKKQRHSLFLLMGATAMGTIAVTKMIAPESLPEEVNSIFLSLSAICLTISGGLITKEIDSTIERIQQLREESYQIKMDKYCEKSPMIAFLIKNKMF